MSFLFVDQIVESSPAEFVRGVKHITPDDLYLTTDEHGKICFVPSLIGETLGQLAAWNVMQYNNFRFRPVAGVVSSACLHRPAYLGETLLLESFIDVLDDKAVQYHSVARVGNETVFTIEGAIGPLLQMDDFIDSAEIQRQFKEINRLGDWAVASSSPDRACVDFELKPGWIAAPMVFDRILDSESGLSLTAEKRVTRSSPYFADHFPKKPVLPLTVLLECKLNLAREFISRSGYSTPYTFKEFRKIKMNEFVQPGDVLVCHVKVKHHTEEELILSYRSEVNGKRVCVVEIVLIRQIK